MQQRDAEARNAETRKADELNGAAEKLRCP